MNGFRFKSLFRSLIVGRIPGVFPRLYDGFELYALRFKLLQGFSNNFR
jgi:hypothetical protein